MSERPTPEEEVDIEQIMQEIRQQIIAKRSAAGVVLTPGVVVRGNRYPPEFYEHLYQAQLALDEYQVPVLVTRSPVPIFGRLIDWMRGKLHELISFYVNQAVARQADISANLLQALSIVGQETDDAADDAP